MKNWLWKFELHVIKNTFDLYSTAFHKFSTPFVIPECFNRGSIIVDSRFRGNDRTLVKDLRLLRRLRPPRNDVTASEAKQSLFIAILVRNL